METRKLRQLSFWKQGNHSTAFLLFCLTLMALGRSVGVAQTFRTGRMIATPVHPNSVAVGDFNEDGILDLVVPSWSPNKVSVILGDGDGGGILSGSFNGVSGPRFGVVLDVNNDGHDDVATANQESDDVSIFLGNGTGALTLLHRVPAGLGPWHLAAGNFNDDSHADLVVANALEGTVTVLLGSGGGNFLEGNSFAVGVTPRAVQPADFNNDGSLDVAISNYGSQSVSILFGDGLGNFGNRIDFSVGPNPFTLATGDFNEDGRLDLAVPNFGSTTVSILLGNEALGFTSGGTLTVGAAPRAVVVQDLDQDGNLDLAVANRNDNSISLLQGNGAGGFTLVRSIGVGSGPFSLLAADLDGDDVLDLAVADRDGHTLSLVKGDGSLRFQAPEVLETGRTPRGVVAKDLDGDGLKDLVVPNAGSSTVSVLRGLGGGAFSVPVNYPVGQSPFAVELADVTGDGVMDMVVANSSNNTISILRGTGGGVFAAQVKWSAGSSPRAISVEDFNGDGWLDVAVANFSSSTVSILLGTGSGAFAAPSPIAVGVGPTAIKSGDFNEDGLTDLVVANYTSGTLGVMLGNGLGAFSVANYISVGSSPAAIDTADFEADNHLDLVIANENANTLTVLRGTGDGGFLSPMVFGSGTRPLGVAVGDINGDSIPDIVAANATSNTLTTHIGAGDGTFIPGASLPGGVFARAVCLVDLDGDSQLDIAAANANSYDIRIFLNRSGALADLAVTIDNGTSSLTRGDLSTYTVTVSNLGPSPVTSVNLQLDVPATLESVAVTPASGAYDSGSGIWSGLNLAAGDSVALTIEGTVSATAAGTLSVEATLIAIGAIDPVSNNNTASDVDNVIKGNAGLMVRVSDGATTVNAGDSISYSIQVGNYGPLEVVGARILVQLPLQLKNRTWSCSASGGAVCVAEGPVGIADSVTLIDEEIDLPAGGTNVFTLSGVIDPLASAGTITVAASVQPPPDIVDLAPADNSASDIDTLVGNNAPVANPQSVSVDEDSSIGIVLTATDADSDPITFTVEQAPAHGTLSGTPPNLTYSPAANYFGADSFTFKADDGIHFSTATISVTVQPINDAPLSAGASLSTDEDVAIGISLGGSDVDGDALTFTIVTPPGLGSLTGSGSIRTYTPSLNVSGADSFTYTVSDGIAQLAAAEVTILINAVNDTPTIVSSINDQNVNGTGTSLLVDLSSTFTDVETPAASLVLSVTSSDNDIAAPVLTGTSLELQLNPNRGGVATITVRSTDAQGAWVEDTFLVTVVRPGGGITISDVSATEGSSAGLVFTVTLSSPSDTVVTVDFATADGTATDAVDYIGSAGTITFQPGVTARTVVIATIGDVIDEQDETVRLILSNPVGTVLEDNEGTGTIVDNDTAYLRILNSSVLEGDGVLTTMTLSITISKPSAEDVTVNYTTANISAGAAAGVDYNATSGSVVFPAGSITPQFITVDVIGDPLDEKDEGFDVIISSPINATIDRGVARATITDNDLPPSVTVSDVNIVEGNSGSKTLTFTATLSQPSGQRARVRYATSDGSALAGIDYQALTGELVFEAGVTSRTIPIRIYGDVNAESDETLLVNLHTPTLLTIGDAQSVGTIVNDDAP